MENVKKKVILHNSDNIFNQKKRGTLDEVSFENKIDESSISQSCAKCQYAWLTEEDSIVYLGCHFKKEAIVYDKVKDIDYRAGNCPLFQINDTFDYINEKGLKWALILEER